MMQIRDARFEDAAAISELVTECVREQIRPTLSDAGLERLLSEMDAFSIESRLRGEFRFFLAEEAGMLVGVSAVQLPSHLYYLFIRTGFQRRGIGRQLWFHARDWIIGTCGSETITVNSSLNAVSVYERLGFQRTGGIAETNDVRCQPMQWTRARERGDRPKP